MTCVIHRLILFQSAALFIPIARTGSCKARPSSSKREHFPVHYAINEQSDRGHDVSRLLSFSEIDPN
jgi:hypothetical protein